MTNNETITQLKNRIAELEQENESYQKLINDICNKHSVGSLKYLDEIYQATNESLYASREYLEELKSAKWELEEQLKNAIVPKFNVGQEVWCIRFMEIIKFKINKVEIYRGEAEEENRIVYGNWEDMVYQIEGNCFATKEEAQAKLRELKGE